MYGDFELSTKFTYDPDDAYRWELGAAYFIGDHWILDAFYNKIEGDEGTAFESLEFVDELYCRLTYQF